MQIRFQNSPQETTRMSTQQLRESFLVQDLFRDDKLSIIYSHYDRMIIGGVSPVMNPIELQSHSELRAEYFLERREIGIINVGGSGIVEADQERFELQKLDCVYLGKGIKNVRFSTAEKNLPAAFYFLSAPAHKTYPNKFLVKQDASHMSLGEQATANKRTIYKYIHVQGIQSCQLVMGLTLLNDGSVWNTMPAHTHTRRTEVYFYFDLAPPERVLHVMGQPQETRHLIVANHEAVISPPWSIHSGCGTSNYGFIWGMAGENLDYTDMDPAPITELK